MSTTTTDEDKTYDLILFGVTGFTGKLAAEYLLHTKAAQQQQLSTKWAACARSKDKAEAILSELAEDATVAVTPPPVLVADLVCEDAQAEATLRSIVKSTRVVITTAGPFEKYGKTLHKLCAEEGVHYADITGETSFLRQVIDEVDDKARETGAVLVSHCGNDCIPQDLTVWEMHQYAKTRGYTLEEVITLDEFPTEASMSGGTLTTAIFQFSKPKQPKNNEDSQKMDPLVKTPKGTKSDYSTVITHKTTTYHKEFNKKAGPWLMAPVMANCVRRSNALLGYNTSFKYGDAMLQDPSWTHWVQQTLYTGMVGAALYVPPLQKILLPQPGQGPSRDTMEAGYLKLHGRGIMVKKNNDDNSNKDDKIKLKSLFHFQKDTGYLMTAELLVETGLLLVSKAKDGSLRGRGGVLTPAVVFGSELTKRITTEMKVTFELTEVKEEEEEEDK